MAVLAIPASALAAEGQAANDRHPFGLLSLVPPILAIGLAIATRRILLSLLAAVFAGALIVAQGNPALALGQTCETYLWMSLVKQDHLRVFIFTVSMGAMVGVMSRAGGMHGIVALMAPWARDRRRGQLTGWGLGLLVFFDDYANTLLLGNTLRPISDRLRISREKLAYVVDSTAAPVAGLALVSTWVATEIGYIDAGFQVVKDLPADSYNAFDIFIATIPYRFYPLLTLVFVPLVAVLARDFGPMLRAERRALRGGPSSTHQRSTEPGDSQMSPDAGTPARWYNAIVPVLAVLATVVALIIFTGWRKLGDDHASVWNMFTQGDSYLALMYGSLVGLGVVVAMARWQRLLTFEQMRAAGEAGGKVVVAALAVLWLAWALQLNVEDLQTPEYVGSLLHGVVSPAMAPTLVFLLAAAVAFATGTSWGTMGILTPIVVGVTYNLLSKNGAVPDPADPILLAAIGSVLAGAIFGDHCSPISDTTVLSSAATQCDHLAHVWTQMPYALVVGGASILCGTLPAGMGIPIWGCLICLLLGSGLLAVFLLVFGRRAEDDPDEPAT